MRVTTFNIRYGRANDGPNGWHRRGRLVAQVIRSIGGDFVGIQEALAGQVAYLNESLGPYRCLSRSREADPAYGEANPLLYRHDRWEIDPGQHGVFWLSRLPSTPGSKMRFSRCPRIVTWARIVEKTTRRAVYLYNTHFSHVSGRARRKSAILLAHRIAGRVHPDPVIVTGDFNTGHSSLAVRYLTGRTRRSPIRLLDAFGQLHPGAPQAGTYHGFTGSKNGARIDYIFVVPEIRILTAEVVYHQHQGRFPSDHHPVTAELALPARPVGPPQSSPG